MILIWLPVGGVLRRWKKFPRSAEPVNLLIYFC